MQQESYKLVNQRIVTVFSRMLLNILSDKLRDLLDVRLRGTCEGAS